MVASYSGMYPVHIVVLARALLTRSFALAVAPRVFLCRAVVVKICPFLSCRYRTLGLALRRTTDRESLKLGVEEQAGKRDAAVCAVAT